MIRKTFLIASYEYWRHVLRRAFIFAVFGLPLLCGLIMAGFAWFLAAGGREPVGVVDLSGRMLPPAQYQPASQQMPPIYAYPDETAARQALIEQEIQAYFVVPADFPDSYEVRLYYEERPHENVSPAFRRYMRAGLLQESDPAVAQRFLDSPANVTFVSLGEERGRGNPAAFILPYIFSLLFIIAIFTTAGYLLQAVVDEKENRTMEILVTSVSPAQLMSGKIVGLVGVGLTQIAVWGGGLIVAFMAARYYIPELAVLQAPLSTVLIALAWFLPFYLLVAALMAAIGVSVTSVSEGQQLAGIISLVSMAPLWLSPLFLNSPNSPLALVLSLFPFSAPITILVRWQITEVPAWQLGVSWALLAATAVFSLFVVGRLLRAGMLRYGQPLSLREAIRSIAAKS